MRKYIFLLTISLSVFSSAFATDIDIISQRYKDLILYSPSKASVDAALALLNVDGSFSDLIYDSKTDNLTVHLTRLKIFSFAHQFQGNTYYKNTSLKNKFYTSLQYWISKNHTPSNWWFRHIGYPMELGPSIVLMSSELQAEQPILFGDSVTYLRWAYLRNNFMEGANGADKIYAALPASIVTQNESQIKEYQAKIKALITVQNKGEGIEVDWMYGQHSTYGRQVYANYGHEYLYSILRTLHLFKGTMFEVSSTELTILDNHFIKGIQWYVYNKKQDPSQTGRVPTSNLNGRFSNHFKILLGLNTPNYNEILKVQDRVFNGNNAASKLIGNRMFWRFDYMIHRRSNYFVSSRLTSTRTVGMESGNGQGINNYYGGAGLNFIMRTGEEYSNNYFSVMNYRQWPGITVEQDTGTLPLVDWGERGTNENGFAGGVSDDFYGAVGNIYNRKNVIAYKSWFYFDNEFVALGSGITQAAGTATVFTTLNQILQKSDILYSKNNLKQSIGIASGSTVVVNPDWVLQDNIGYINMLASSVFKISSDRRSGTDIFTVGVDHGVSPKNSSYAYIVYPNTDVLSLNAYKDKNPIQILSNSTKVQAVHHKTLKITQALFFEPGNLTLTDGKLLSVNLPCAVMIKDSSSTYKITVSNPLCETSNPAKVLLTINTPLNGKNITYNGTLSTVDVSLPQGNYAGQSVTIIANKTDENPTGNLSNINFDPILCVVNIKHRHFSVEAIASMREIKIFDLSGRLVQLYKLNNNLRFDDNFNHPNGTYIAKIQFSDGRTTRQKLINY